jgi:hypothetical protein
MELHAEAFLEERQHVQRGSREEKEQRPSFLLLLLPRGF